MMLLNINFRGSAKNYRSAKSSRSTNATRVFVLLKLKYILSESLIFSRASVTPKLIYLKYYGVGGFARQPKMHESMCVCVLPDLLRSSLFTKQKYVPLYICRNRTFFPFLIIFVFFLFFLHKRFFYYTSERSN